MANTAVVYGREYKGKKLTFEISGGLIDASLVIQDRETDSFWSIMTGDAIDGDLKGTKLNEMPSVKMQWKNWVKQYPNTLVLSVSGSEDISRNVYYRYFNSEDGFGGIEAADKRLKTKESIFAFQFQNKKYAVSFKEIEEGRVFDLGGTQIFLYRPKNAAIFHSTNAYHSTGKGFSNKNGKWQDTVSGCQFNSETGKFEGNNKGCPEQLKGFDTFWYNWSLIHNDTEVLGK